MQRLVEEGPDVDPSLHVVMDRRHTCTHMNTPGVYVIHIYTKLIIKNILNI